MTSTEKPKDNKGRDEEARAKEQGEGLGPRDAQGNPVPPPAPNQDLPEQDPAAPNQDLPEAL